MSARNKTSIIGILALILGASGATLGIFSLISIQTQLNIVAGDTTLRSRAYLNSSKALPAGSYGIVELDTETYDLGNYFNTAAHMYYVSKTGYYQVTGAVKAASISSITTLRAGIFVNGICVVENQAYCGSPNCSSSVSDLILLTVGDFVSLQAYIG